MKDNWSDAPRAQPRPPALTPRWVCLTGPSAQPRPPALARQAYGLQTGRGGVRSAQMDFAFPLVLHFPYDC